MRPPVLAAFVADRSPRLGKTGVRDLCGTLRVLLRYLYREQVLPRDLSMAVDAPHAYRLPHIPRSVTWEEVRWMLSVVERRKPARQRDYAILLRLVTYGLRAWEVAALMLDHIDWKRERLHVPVDLTRFRRRGLGCGNKPPLNDSSRSRLETDSRAPNGGDGGCTNLR